MCYSLGTDTALPNERRLTFIKTVFTFFLPTREQFLARVQAHSLHRQVPPLYAISISALAKSHLDENKIQKQLKVAK